MSELETNMEQYHGTNTQTATAISNGQVDVNYGGGELGKGFYVGDLIHEAFTWAWHQYQVDKAVVKFTMDDDQLLGLNPLCLDFFTTWKHRKMIKYKGQTRTFLFDENIIWTPVVGKHIPNFNQMKFESQQSESFINSNMVAKTIL